MQTNWWGDFTVPLEGSIHWQIGAFSLHIERHAKEWLILQQENNLPDLNEQAWSLSRDGSVDFAAGDLQRHIFNQTGDWLRILPRLADRPVVVNMEKSVGRVLKRHFTAHKHILLKRIVFYALLLLFLFAALKQVGFDLSVFLDAAGVLSVAIGFASQTSASNLISGLFLLGERPFEVGDIIHVGDITGEVLSIDLLSAKLWTFDNLYVRIPNETMLKTEVTNLTRFPIRRLDMQIGVVYKENIEKVREILLQVAKSNPLSLEDPKPLFIFLGFGDSALNLQFSVWAKRENFLDLKNSIQYEIKLAFDEHQIEIPFPHLTLYTGSVTEPFPVKLVVEQQETTRSS